MAKGWTEHSWRAVAETASVLWVVTKQCERDSWLAVGTLASGSHARDGAGGSQNVGTAPALQFSVEQPLGRHHALAQLGSRLRVILK